MRNDYEPSEAIEVGKAQEQILSQKFVGDMDNFGVPNYEAAPTLDDFDE
jgi:hypothetical protein